MASLDGILAFSDNVVGQTALLRPAPTEIPCDFALGPPSSLHMAGSRQRYGFDQL